VTGGRNGVHTVGASGSQQGVRVRIRAAGKALEGMSDTQMMTHGQHGGLLHYSKN